MKLMCGNANKPLAQAIADYLDAPLSNVEIETFADGELFVRIDENMRGEDVFIIQSTSKPANDNLMELLICMDALTRASARRITAVIPYFGYARQDRKTGGRTPITAKLVANLIAGRRGAPGFDAGPACRSDPGLFRHSDRQSVRDAGLRQDIRPTTTSRI
jgi:ribose-phosphate pyrophosphokinase